MTEPAPVPVMDRQCPAGVTVIVSSHAVSLTYVLMRIEADAHRVWPRWFRGASAAVSSSPPNIGFLLLPAVAPVAWVGGAVSSSPVAGWEPHRRRQRATVRCGKWSWSLLFVWRMKPSGPALLPGPAVYWGLLVNRPAGCQPGWLPVDQSLWTGWFPASPHGGYKGSGPGMLSTCRRSSPMVSRNRLGTALWLSPLLTAEQ